MTEEIKTAATADEPVARLLELQSRYGMDQETMLLYLSSVNLMSILNLLSRRQGGGVNLSMAVPPAAPVLPPLAPGAAPGGAPSLENLAGMLMKMLGSQGGGGSPGGGINPAMLTSLLSAFGQNVDLGAMMNMLAGLMGPGSKPAPKPVSGSAPQAASTTETGSSGGKAGEANVAGKPAGESTAVKREVPKIMKWDQLDERKKA